MPDEPGAMKVLIVRVGAMGDVLHALPAAVALRQARPAWRIDWIVDERWRSLLDDDVAGSAVDHVLPVPVREWKRFPRSFQLLHSLQELRNLRQIEYDVVVDLQGTMRSAVIGRVTGGSRLAGYADPREGAAKLFYRRQIARRGAHVVEQGAALLGEACGVPIVPTVPGFAEVFLNQGTERGTSTYLASLGAERDLSERLAVLAPSAGWAAKQWPTSHFAALAQELAQQGWTVLVNNPGEHEPAATQVLAAAGGAASGISCGVAEFTALLRRAALVIGGDSGPVHLAATLGVPLIALFGPTDPARNGPWGPGPKRVLRHPASVTSYRHVAVEDAGLAHITVAEVLEAVQSLNSELTAVCENKS